jgi:uncharacterized protein YyaL (SSP411 family)
MDQKRKNEILLLKKPEKTNNFLLSLCLLVPLLLSFSMAFAQEGTATNRLSKESSPYLLKHAVNPVDWHPWGEEAFTLAKEQDKPIFLSIGYSTCHWCNVMEDESFANPQVAALINEVFVPIKVDREERPDIDQIYMKACQLLSPSCGWPLTLFLVPDGKPFYATTYIPKENRFGRLGLLELIPRVQKLWKDERQELLKSAESINAAIISSTIYLPGAEMDAKLLDAAFTAYTSNYDEQYGGFGSGTKFPNPNILLYLLRYWKRTGNTQALAMVEQTLTAMRQGGIYDHLGFGYHRYSTDRMWRLPHFEKMLYDQALLIIAYIETHQATTKKEYAKTAIEIIDYILTDMSAPEGGFYSALSADSEGEEGKFYLWQAQEINQTLSDEEAATARSLFQIKQEGNYIDSVTGEKTGLNILYIKEGSKQPEGFESIRKKLLTARNQRPRPERDDKVLTDWNGLMIGALAKAAKVLDQPEFGKAAQRSAAFILDNLQSKDGKLLHRWRLGQAGLSGNAADYAFLTWGLLELYEWDFDIRWLGAVHNLTNELIKNFWDKKLGGFYLTGEQKESFLPRIKESADSALPSSNSVAMHNLIRLSRLTGNHTYAEKAAKISSVFSSKVKDSAPAYPMLLSSLDFALAPSQEIVIVGHPGTADTEKLLKVLRKNYLPNAVVLFKPAAEVSPPIVKYAGFVEFMGAINNKATAYVCTNFKCDFPTTDPLKMLENINAIASKTGKK